MPDLRGREKEAVGGEGRNYRRTDKCSRALYAIIYVVIVFFLEGINRDRKKRTNGPFLGRACMLLAWRM